MNPETLVLKRNSLLALIGTVPSEQQELPLKGTLSSQFKKVIKSSEFTTIDDEGFPKKARSALQDKYQPLGLRQLLASKN